MWLTLRRFREKQEGMRASAFLGLSAVVAVGITAGCNVDSAAVTDDVTATQYMTILEFPNGENEGAWYDINSKLDQEFRDICGDTFCGGDYSNLTPLTFSCSVSTKAGTVHECAYTFAGSLTSVDPKTSVIGIDAPTFECRIHPKTTASKLIKLLSSSNDALHEPLPGGAGSIYDELVDCFQHPINKTPVTFSSEPNRTYVAAVDYYATAANQTKWRNAQSALQLGFDNICGDTFCGSDYGDLQSLEFQCSVTKSTGNVKECEWIFGGSYSVVATKGGALNETDQTWRCKVPVKGSITQLVNVLTAPGTDSAIRRPLPGGTATAYDALGGCLP